MQRILFPDLRLNGINVCFRVDFTNYKDRTDKPVEEWCDHGEAARSMCGGRQSDYTV